jgi:hypothetical protein
VKRREQNASENVGASDQALKPTKTQVGRGSYVRRMRYPVSGGNIASGKPFSTWPHGHSGAACATIDVHVVGRVREFQANLRDERVGPRRLP